MALTSSGYSISGKTITVNQTIPDGYYKGKKVTGTIDATSVYNSGYNAGNSAGYNTGYNAGVAAKANSLASDPVANGYTFKPSQMALLQTGVYSGRSAYTMSINATKGKMYLWVCTFTGAASYYGWEASMATGHTITNCSTLYNYNNGQTNDGYSASYNAICLDIVTANANGTMTSTWCGQCADNGCYFKYYCFALN